MPAQSELKQIKNLKGRFGRRYVCENGDPSDARPIIQHIEVQPGAERRTFQTLFGESFAAEFRYAKVLLSANAVAEKKVRHGRPL